MDPLAQRLDMHGFLSLLIARAALLTGSCPAALDFGAAALDAHPLTPAAGDALGREPADRAPGRAA
jgi:hypothetical protein